MFPDLLKKETRKSVEKKNDQSAYRRLVCSLLQQRHFENIKPQHSTTQHGLVLVFSLLHFHPPVCLAIHPFLLSPVGAELVIQPPSGGGPLRRHPAYAPLHEAQRFLPGAHLLQQIPDLGLENSLHDRSNKIIISVEDVCCGLVFYFFVWKFCTKSFCTWSRKDGMIKKTMTEYNMAHGRRKHLKCGSEALGGFSPRKLWIDTFIWTN